MLKPENTGSHSGRPSDEDLMRSLRLGDRNAFCELYDRYSKKLLFYFSKMLGYDKPKAEDMLHDLFVKVMEKPEMFDLSRKFSTWIYQVATNMCRNEWRNHATRNTVMDQHIIPGYADVESPRVHEQMDAQKVKQTIHSVYRELNETERCIFILRFNHELPLKEIAVILDCPEGTVKSRIFYLLKKFTPHLKHFQSYA